MKKGFTLVELLGVVVLLGIVALIALPKVSDVLNNQKQQLYKNEVNQIEKIAESYVAKHTDILSEDDSIYISIKQLIDSGLLKVTEAKNPQTDELMEGCVEIKLDKDYNQYVYKFIDAKADGYNNECG